MFYLWLNTYSIIWGLLLGEPCSLPFTIAAIYFEIHHTARHHTARKESAWHNKLGSQLGLVVFVPAVHLCGPRFDTRTGALHVDWVFQSLTDCMGFHIKGGCLPAGLQLLYLHCFLHKKLV